ncbi:hypothetical protein NUW54_g5355 [Trametes sanguinea]|uniref:Uncharacterized protein n=1 Tax=Trametes sanguinea TaxID=158606 RepID=A0ACC1PWW3_9APHY|nr:hypothetical protein NUW54_g5355 [Trametes sanguinea]
MPALPPPDTPKPKAPRRAEQPVGKHFMTPETRRPTRKTAAFVVRPELDMRLKSLHTKLDSLTNDPKPSNAVQGPIVDVDMAGPPDPDFDTPMEDSYADDVAGDLGHDKDGKSKGFRPRTADALKSVHAAWLALIPSVLEDYNSYLQSAHSRTVQVKPDWRFSCPSGTCYVQTSLILCLHFDFLVSVQVSYCDCRDISRRLVSNGLFPTSPSQPRVAISIDLLDFYFALFERSADAVSALASALKTFYERRGFPVLDSKGEPVRDPFRRGLSNAIQWYDHLRHQHDCAIELAIDNCLAMVDDKLSKNAMRDAISNAPEKLADAGDTVMMGLAGEETNVTSPSAVQQDRAMDGTPMGYGREPLDQPSQKQSRGYVPQGPLAGQAPPAAEHSASMTASSNPEDAVLVSPNGRDHVQSNLVSKALTHVWTNMREHLCVNICMSFRVHVHAKLRRADVYANVGSSVCANVLLNVNRHLRADVCTYNRVQVHTSRDAYLHVVNHQWYALETYRVNPHSGSQRTFKESFLDVLYSYTSSLRRRWSPESEANRLRDCRESLLSNPSNPSLAETRSTSTEQSSSNMKSPIPEAPLRTERQLVPGRCHRILQKRCPACFGGSRFGRDFRREGGDIHVAMDATFSQRHNTSAGDSPWHYDAEFFISKEQVDAVGDRIASARKKGAKPFSSRVPEAALDECRKSFEAADEKKEKTTGKKFDDTGLMALVCRHDIVLFLANVDTPGEQQKFAIALLEHFFSLVPDSATVAVLYDIGCVLDRSVHSYDILPESIVRRLIFATSVMHAYGHQWSCQIVYNPRLREGLGLTEGEGTERVWSKFRKLIGVTRTSGRSRRIWLLDRHAKFVNEASRADLGFWIRNKLKHGVGAREAAAKTQLEQCGITVQELRHQWELQQADQLSEKRHAPARVKKELDAVLGLQTELESIQQHLTAVQESITAGGDNPTSRHFLESLRKSHTKTVTKVDDLYASLNVSEGFPELQHLPLDFVRILLMARDLKINIRKRAIGSFFEWDKLDRAAGGRDQPLGTKLHQQTRKAISKRTPALMTAIRKFNGYCDALRVMCKPGWNVSLPCHLPTELSALREDSSLLTDVWISAAETCAPRWLEDPEHPPRDTRSPAPRSMPGGATPPWGRGRQSMSLTPGPWGMEEAASADVLLACDTLDELVGDNLDGPHETSPLPAEHSGDSPSGFERHPNWPQAAGLSDLNDSSSQEPDMILQCVLYLTILDPTTHTVDTSPFPDYDIEHNSFDLTSKATLVIPQAGNLERVLFPAKELRRLGQLTAWLSDDCINGGAQALLRHYGSSSTLGGTPSLLSTRVFSLHLDDVDDDRLWRHCSHSQYWTKDVWLLPIHRLLPSGHWTLAVIYWREGKIAYFDSMADKHVWEQDVQVRYFVF